MSTPDFDDDYVHPGTGKLISATPIDTQMINFLRARAEAAEAQRDEAYAALAKVGEELEQERVEYKHVSAECDRLKKQLDAALFGRELQAERDALRAALEKVRDAMRASDQEPDGMPDPRRPLATAVWAALHEVKS